MGSAQRGSKPLRLLLDTHILLWNLLEPAHLGREVVAALEAPLVLSRCHRGSSAQPPSWLARTPLPHGRGAQDGGYSASARGLPEYTTNQSLSLATVCLL